MKDKRVSFIPRRPGGPRLGTLAVLVLAGGGIVLGLGRRTARRSH
ncbi:hypothetical protein ACFV4T_35285 [Streptomyces sp. NPDC059755]